jgi:multiple sugar transport system permease protein
MTITKSAGSKKSGDAASRLRLSLRTREAIAGYLFISPWAIGFLVFVLGAMIASLVISLYDTNLLNRTQFVGLRNYEAALNDPLFWKSLTVTSYYTFTVVPLQTIAALFMALLLNQKLLGQGIFRTIFYLPSMVSSVALISVWWWMFNRDLGLINGALALIGISPGPAWLNSEQWAMPAIIIMTVWGSGGSMLIFLGGLQAISQELYEAAMIDGASTVRRFIHITIPMLSPTIFFSLVMGIIGSFQVFNASYLLTAGGPNNATLTFVLFLYRRTFEALRFGYGSALAWILFGIILLFTLLIFRSSNRWVYYEAEVPK